MASKQFSCTFCASPLPCTVATNDFLAYNGFMTNNERNLLAKSRDGSFLGDYVYGADGENISNVAMSDEYYIKRTVLC